MLIQVLVFSLVISSFAAATDAGEQQQGLPLPTSLPASCRVWRLELSLCAILSLPLLSLPPDNTAYGFFAVWSALLTIAYSVGGTLVLRRIEYRTPLAVGFMLGVGFVMVRAEQRPSLCGVLSEDSL